MREQCPGAVGPHCLNGTLGILETKGPHCGVADEQSQAQLMVWFYCLPSMAH